MGAGEAEGMRKKKPRPRTPGPEEARYSFIVSCERQIKARIKAGKYRDRPEMEAAMAEFDPAVELIEIAADPANAAETRAACNAKLLPFWHKEQSLLVKEAGSGNAPVAMQISVAPWASAKPVLPALPPPDDVFDV
jgi:hypothetical protein